MENAKDDVINLKRKNKELLNYQPSFQIPENPHKCIHCYKLFATEEFLFAHIKRRHENPPLMKTESDKLQLEIKELKERLNSTEKYIQGDHTSIQTQIVSHDNNEQKQTHNYLEIQTEVDYLRSQIANQSKLIDEQKFYQEKYEKWMEVALEKFEKKQMEIVEKKLKQFNRQDIWTQTSENRTTETQYEVIGVPNENQTNKLEEELVALKNEFITKIHDDLETDAKKRFERFEGVFEEKFEKIGKKIDSFWKKFEEKTPTEIEKSPCEFSENVYLDNLTREENVPSTPKPQPRKSLSHTKTASFLPSSSYLSKGVMTIQANPVKDNSYKPEVKVIQPVKPMESTETSSEIDSKTSNRSELVATKPSFTSTLGRRSITR